MEDGRELDDYRTPEEKYRDEKAAKAKISNLTDAMAILLRLEGMFCEKQIEPTKGFKAIGYETGRKYHTFPELFALQFEGADKTPLFTKSAFAQAKAKEIEGVLRSVEGLAEPSYYSSHPAYIMALGYIEYLQKYNENETGQHENHNPKGRPKASDNMNFKTLLSCSNDEKDAVIQILKKHYIPGSGKGIVEVVAALEKKDYFSRPAARGSIWNALRKTLGNISSDSNLNNLYNSADKEKIRDIRKQLP